MKKLTYQELQKAPTIIQYIYMASVSKIPIGASTVDEAIKKHPEYFPDEVEHRRKWDLIPEEVHQAYNKEMSEMMDKIYEDMPEQKGMFAWSKDPEGYKEWEDKFYECREKEKPLSKHIHEKYYSKYGIEWNGV